MIQRCALCGRTGLDVESRIVADESPLGFHREARCVDVTACEERAHLTHAFYAKGCAECEAMLSEYPDAVR